MTLRLVLVGTGGIAQRHAEAIRNQPDTQICAVVTTKTDGAAEFRQRFHVPRAYPTVEALVQNEQADGVVVCTPNALHMAQTIQALRGGMHVLVEKPMAVNAQEAKAMNHVSQETGCLLMVGHCWRFDNEVNWLKEHKGQLGQIFRTKGYSVHTNWGPPGWFTQKALAGGGALADMGIHAIDTTRYLLGDPLPMRVYARIGTHYIDADVDDTGMILIDWDNGVSSYVESGWWQPHTDGVEAATQLYGQDGFGSVFPTYLQLHKNEDTQVIDPEFSFPREDHGPQEIYDRQMAHFLECIRTGQTPVPGGQEGWINVRICDAAYTSSLTGESVQL